MPARLENVVEANQVGLHVRVRVRNRIAHARLGSKVHDHREIVLFEQGINERFVSQITLDKREVRVLFEFLKTVFLETHIIVRVHIVKTDYIDALVVVQNTLRKIRTNETCGAGDKNRLTRQLNMVFHALYLTHLHQR